MNSNESVKEQMLLFKVSKRSNSNRLAEAIYKTLLEETPFEVQAIGAGAVNQAVKALAIARGKMAQGGRDISFIAGFRDIPDLRKDDGENDISAMNFRVKIER